MTRTAAGFAALDQERLDDAVLKRVEGHHHQPAAGLENAFGGGERRDQFAQFVVDEDAQRLKRARRGVYFVGLGPHHLPTMDASAAVVRIGASVRARTMARATPRE